MKVKFKHTNTAILDDLYIGDIFIYPEEPDSLYLFLNEDFEVINLVSDTIRYFDYDTKVIKIPHSKITITVEN